MKIRWTLSILIICAVLDLNVGLLVADGDWKRKADMPIVKWDHTAEAIKGKIYVFGGDNLKNPGEPFVTVEAYDTGEVPQSVEPTGKLTTTWGQLKQ